MAGKIVVEIDEEGGTQVSVEGVAGADCKALTKGLEEALGKVTEDRPTADMHRRASRSAEAKAGR